MCPQYRLIIQFFMVAALVATNVFNVFTMNLGTTGLPLGQVGSMDADTVHCTMHDINTMLFAAVSVAPSMLLTRRKAAEQTSTLSSCRATLSETRSSDSR